MNNSASITKETTNTTYNHLSKFFHWSTVLLLIAQFSSIWTSQIAFRIKDKALAYSMLDLHKALGLAVLAVVVLRLLWRWIGGLPEWAEGLQEWEKKSAHKLEVWLYRLLFLLPLTGIAYSMTSGYPIHFFDIFSIPKLMQYEMSLSILTWFVHMTCAYLLVAVVALHIGFVVRRTIFEKDRYIKRMWY